MAADAENDRYVSVKCCISFGMSENAIMLEAGGIREQISNVIIGIINYFSILDN